MFKPLAKLGINTAYSYIEKDPEKNMGKLMDWVDKFAGDDEETNFHKQRAVVRDVIDHPESNWYQFVMRLFNETDNDVLKKIFTNFVLNAVLTGWKTQEAAREKYQCNIPWAILMDPTSACNLHCTGCWAAEYGNKLNLSFEDLDSIITQGKELGVYLYIYTGGEPLVRKKDLIALCNKHSDCVFLCFTNSTLIDEEFADEMLRVKNFVPAISLEGFETANDSRRGDGVYQKVMHAMQILRDRKLPFGISTCYTSVNCNDITSEEFIDQVIGMGAKFAWFFHYMPVGQDAATELLPTPEQRKMVFEKIRAYRSTKPLFTMDFQNDAEYVGGCIAGGRRYLHINAAGDVDPCVFIHYSNANIHDVSLLDALRSPLFMAYHDNQPFNENMLRPCPMLENPEILPKLVAATGAHSTDPQAPETADTLCARTTGYAADWTPVAEELWKQSPRCTGNCAGCGAHSNSHPPSLSSSGRNHSFGFARNFCVFAGSRRK